jgi:hypothetical protein
MGRDDVRLVNVPVKARPAARNFCPDGMYILMYFEDSRGLVFEDTGRIVFLGSF